MRQRLVWVLLLGATFLLMSPEIEAKRSFKSQGKRACSMTCFGGGYNKCRVVGVAKPNQCPPSQFFTP